MVTPQRKIVRVTYSKAMDRVRMVFDDRTIYVVPRRLLEGLDRASADQLRKIEILDDGPKLYWPQLDVRHRVSSLLSGQYGSPRWMTALDRVPPGSKPGGPLFSSRPRKAAAALRQFFTDEKVFATNALAERRPGLRRSRLS